MKERIQEALRRRHRKGDEGFTLIELLVVILIIAILAAVGLVALFSALNSGKKSAAKTTLRQAMTAIKSEQTGRGITDFNGLTDTVMDNAEPDIDFVISTTPLTSTGNVNKVSILAGTDDLYLASRADNGVCYHVHLQSNDSTLFASAKNASCVAGTLAGTDQVAFTKDNKAGWNN